MDLLQKNVEGALPKRHDLLLTRDSDLIRRHSPYTTHAQFVNLEDYLDSFVYADEEEVTSEEADRRAEAHAELLDKIDELKSQGRLKKVESIRPFIDPEVPKLHYNWLMEHIMTSSRLIKREGELQMQRARKVSKMILRHFEILNGKSEREQREEEKRIKKLAKLTSNEVKKKWRYVEGVSLDHNCRCHAQFQFSTKQLTCFTFVFVDCPRSAQGVAQRRTRRGWKATLELDPGAFDTDSGGPAKHTGCQHPWNPEHPSTNTRNS